MIRQWFAGGVALAGLLGASPAQMQEGEWSGYLFDSSEKSLQRVTVTGDTTDVTLAIPEGAFVGGRDLSFSPDGTIVAFCSVSGAETRSYTSLTIQNLENGSVLLQKDVGDAFSCRATLGEGAEQVALMTLRNSQQPGELPDWTLQVLDAASGAVVAELLSSQLTDAQVWERSMAMPIVRDFTDDTVTFGVFPLGEGPGMVPAYAWSIADGSVTPADEWGYLYYAWLPETGEMAYAQEDPALPMGNPGGPMPSSNVVRVQDSGGNVRTIYASGADWVIGSLAFIDSGRALAIQLIQSVNFDQPEQRQAVRWVALDRTGEVTDLPLMGDFVDVRGATDGYAALLGRNMNGEGMPEMSLELTTPEGTVTVWSANMQFGGVTWELPWTTPMITAPNLAPFPEA